MTSKNIGKVFIVVLSVVFASHIVYKYYRKKRKIVRPEVNEVIMFSYGVTAIKRSKHSRCMITTSMDRLLYYLNSPRHSIDICMYVLTNIDVMNVILMHNIRGIKIRVIMDADMAFSTGSSLKRFEKQGIPVRWTKSTNHMHHKFCIIDTQTDDVNCIPLVIMGSLNWTNQALHGNWEDVVVTSQADIVRQYKTEFERLWLQFKPIIDMA